MIKTSLAAVSLILSLNSHSTLAFATDSKNEILVKVQHTSDFNSFLEIANQTTLALSDSLPVLRTTDGIWYKVRLPHTSSQSFLSQANLIRSKIPVMKIEQNSILQPDVYNDLRDSERITSFAKPPLRTQPPVETKGTDPFQIQQWAAEKLNMSSIWSAKIPPTPAVIVADIDTGIDYNHDDLFSNLWINNKEIKGDRIDNDGNGFVDDIIGWDFCDNDGLPFDTNVHGTHTAGVIAAGYNNSLGVSGYAPGIKLMPIRLLAANGGTIEQAVLSIQYAVKNGASVISASWGSGDNSQILLDAIKVAGEKNVTFVAAAGNKWSNLDDASGLKHYPAGFTLPNLITVAGTMQDDSRLEYSNWGPKSVHLAAPGFDIISTVPTNKYQLLEGTSMATPHVSAAVALVKRANPALTPTQIRTIIMSSVDQDPKIRYLVASGGRLNVARAVEMAKATAQKPIQ